MSTRKNKCVYNTGWFKLGLSAIKIECASSSCEQQTAFFSAKENYIYCYVCLTTAKPAKHRFNFK